MDSNRTHQQHFVLKCMIGLIVYNVPIFIFFGLIYEETSLAHNFILSSVKQNNGEATKFKKWQSTLEPFRCMYVMGGDKCVHLKTH